MSTLYEYPNGMKLVHSYNPNVRSVCVRVGVSVGSVNETESENGMSHFVEHMLFKGTEKRTSQDITNDFERTGAMFNAGTSKQMTSYYFVSIDEMAERCTEVLSDIFFNSIFPEQELELERTVILEEIAQSLDLPEDVCYDALSLKLYGAHPIARRILGTRDTVQSFTREKLMAYRDRCYSADNTILSIAGNLNYDEARRLAEKYFVTNFVRQSAQLYSEPFTAFETGRVENDMKIEQANFAIAYPALTVTDPRSATMAAMNIIFGGSMGSRLFQHIRERKGLAYTVYGSSSAYRSCGDYTVFTSLKPQNLQKAYDAVLQEAELLKKEGVTESELESAKTQYKTSVVLEQEKTASVASLNMRSVAYFGEPYDIDKKMSEIQAVTREGIRELANYVFDENKTAVSVVVSSNS